MATAVRENVFGPNNRILAAQFQTKLYYEHSFGSRTPYDGRYPWRSVSGYGILPTRSTNYKYTYLFTGATVTYTYSNQIVFGSNDAMARRTTLGTTEASSYYQRQGGITELVQNEKSPMYWISGDIKPDPSIPLAFTNPSQASEVQSLYSQRSYYQTAVPKAAKNAQNFCEIAKTKGLDGLLAPDLLFGNTQGVSNMPPLPSSGWHDEFRDSHHCYAKNASTSLRWRSLSLAEGDASNFYPSRITYVPTPVSQDSGLYARDTDGVVSDSEPNAVFYKAPMAVPVTQNASGLLADRVYGRPLPIMFSPKIVNGKRVWYVLFQMAGIYDREPLYKYYEGLRYALAALGQLSFNTFASQEPANSASNFRAPLIDNIWLDGVTTSQLMAKYPYAAQDSNLSKATTRFCDNWDFSVAGEWTTGNLSVHQFWTMPVSAFAAASSADTRPTVTEIGEMAPKTITIAFSGISSTTVVSEGPKQSWEKGKAYRSTHISRKSADIFVYTSIEYFVTDAFVKQGESQKTFIGFIAHRSYRFDRSGDTCVQGVGKVNRWLTADHFLDARHFDGLALLPAGHSEAAKRPIPFSWTSHSMTEVDYGDGLISLEFSRTLERASRYSNYLFRSTAAGVIGQAYTVFNTNIINAWAPGTESPHDYDHTGGSYYSHRYYLDGDELKVQTPYLPDPLVWSYDADAGPSTNTRTESGLTSLPPIAVIGTDGAITWVNCTSSFLTVSGTPLRTLTALAGTKAYSAPLFDVKDFKIEVDPSGTVLTGKNGRAESQPQILKLSVNSLGVLTTRTPSYFEPNAPSPAYEAIMGAVSDTFGKYGSGRFTSYSAIVSGVFRALSASYYDTSSEYAGGVTYLNSTVGGVRDISPFNNVDEDYAVTSAVAQLFSTTQLFWAAYVDAPSAIPVATSFGQNWPIALTSDYTVTLIPNVGYQYHSSASGILLWPVMDGSVTKRYPPEVLDHGIYCHYEYPTNNKYAVIYWKPGADIAWRVASPFLLDGAKMPTLAEVEALVSQDAAALDTHYSYLLADQTTIYNQAVAAYASLSSNPKFGKLQKPPSQYPLQYATKRAAEWTAVKVELMNLKTVWTNNKLAEDGGDDTDKDNKIALRKTAAEKLWKATREIKHNNFLSESFFLKHPAKDRVVIVEDKDVVDQLRA